MLQVGDAEKFPHALGFKSLDPFFRVGVQGPCFTATEENGVDKRLVKPLVVILTSLKLWTKTGVGTLF